MKMKTCNKLIIMLPVLSLPAVLMSGCQWGISIGIGDFVTEEGYSNAEA